MRRGTRSVILGVAGVAAAVAMVLGVLALAQSGDVDAQLGDEEFRAGRVDSLIGAIERDGPIAFPDAAGSGRPIYVHHTGDDDRQGWLALAALAPGGDGCVLEWDAGAEEAGAFTDPCGGGSYPPGDSRLTRYPTRVDDDLLYVDLRPG